MNNNREDRIIQTYDTYGAKLIYAHGSLTGTKEVVPKNTIIMFLAKPGYCIIEKVAKKVFSDFFENKRGLLQFFKSGNDRIQTQGGFSLH